VSLIVRQVGFSVLEPSGRMGRLLISCACISKRILRSIRLTNIKAMK